MCGIFGYNGKEPDGVKKILEGIHRLEHRGYDSMGMAFLTGGKIECFKVAEDEKAGFDIKDLAKKIPNKKVICNIGIGHTRWATYGGKTVKNAHPHFSNGLFIVHNGNVENFEALKKEIDARALYSETDSEVIVKLTDKMFQESGDLVKSIEHVMNMLVGANVMLLMSKDHPGQLFAANKGGTLLLGKSDSGIIIASDPSAFEGYHIIKKRNLETNEVAVIHSNCWDIIAKEVVVTTEDNYLQDVGKNNYAFYMEKEIVEQASVLHGTMSGRLIFDKGNTRLGGINEIARELRNVKTFHFVGCGTAYNACSYAALLFNRFGISARAWIASEFCYSHPVFSPKDAFFFISQSGETADTIEVIEEIQIKGNICLGIVNVPDSRIACLTDAGVYIRAGKEKAVASTKAFTAQLVTIALLAIYLARQRKMTIDTGMGIIEELILIPEKIEKVLKQKNSIKRLAKKYKEFKNYYFLGRYFNSVVAQEGALKLKEISYVHAESYPLGEMKHGPLALIDSCFCSVVIIPNDSVYSKGVVNVREIKGRNGVVIAVVTEGNRFKLADDIIEIPEIKPRHEYLYPIIATIPLQLFAYYMALELGFNPDKPRNLAKTVTVG